MPKAVLFCFQILMVLVLIAAVPTTMFAATEAAGDPGETHSILPTLLWIAVFLIAAKLSSLVEKIGQPSVLGELVIGVVLGNLTLLGIHWLDGARSDAFIPFLAELGVIILLFQVGLESNIAQMRRVGTRAFLVAIIGVVAPFALGTYIVGPWLLPGLSANAYLFLGAALTATSVGITARVFRDLGKLQLPEAQIVLGAAVIDDVMGLVILAVISAIVTVGAISVGGVVWILAKAILFLVGSIVLGQLLAPRLGKWFSRIHTGVGMKFTLAIGFALLFSYAAGKIGLAPIVGAFAAGLVLDPVHFKFFDKPDVHVEELIEPVALFLVPLFFVWTGFSVNLQTLFDPRILAVATVITVVAFIGKYVSGFAAGHVNKNLVGFGMVPRGEVGLIFATIGRSLGVVNDEIFSVIVIMVILTTLLTPPILTLILKRDDGKLRAAA
ncbi:MAG TPA: cation:proton antiporter [Verrucomicrobiae bacterium]|nr:cation:proton antiporter [Verrucomicrobiae bacterium]